MLNESATETKTTCLGRERCNVKILNLLRYFFSVHLIGVRVVNH